MTDELNAPIDIFHLESIMARDEIREQFDALRQHVALWEPRPCPERDSDGRA